jgi:hypothetical protein
MEKNTVQKVEAVLPGRIETGAVQFNDDWPGLFVRGDDAVMLLAILEEYVLTPTPRKDSAHVLFADQLAMIITNWVFWRER